MEKADLNNIVNKFIDETVELAREIQESPDRFFYLLQGENKKYLLIKNDYFDLPKYEEKLFGAVNVRLVNWILPKENDGVVSLLDDGEFVDIEKYFIGDKNTQWNYALAEVVEI
jgi:hypothetical protein